MAIIAGLVTSYEYSASMIGQKIAIRIMFYRYGNTFAANAAEDTLGFQHKNTNIFAYDDACFHTI